jgi:hypothetical protein
VASVRRDRPRVHHGRRRIIWLRQRNKKIRTIGDCGRFSRVVTIAGIGGGRGVLLTADATTPRPR